MLAEKPVAVSFDCYGTLIDWEAGLERSLLFILREKPDPPGLDKVIAAWNKHERVLTSGKEGYRRYRDVVAEALQLAFAELGVPFLAKDGFRLANEMGRWEPFDDVPGALAELHGLGYQLAIFSNTDDDILAQSVRRMGVKPDVMVTAEQVKAYKPDETVFLEGLKRLHAPADRVLHTSFSFYHDLEPARALGFRTFWVDRKGLGESEVEVDARSRDLSGLTTLLRQLALP
ncbi:MAG: haloacid dehalogenase type II [Halobacteriales archaeon]|nr:haloacid dehalogenase type II [Halobacteriales archaeon]